MLRCHIWELLGVKRLFSLSLSFFSFSGLQQAHFWATSNWHINFGSRIRHLALAAVPQVSCMYDIGCCSTIFCGLLSFSVHHIFCWFPFDVFRFWFDFVRYFLSVYVFRSSFSSCTLSSSRVFQLFLFPILYDHFCLSSFLNGKSLNVPSLLLCFTVSIKYISLRFLYTYISYVHVTEWTRISYIPRCKLINALYIYIC